jgi:hypothetical protein
MSETIWSDLVEAAASGGPSSGMLRRLIHPECPCEMYAAVQKPSLTRVFMVFVGAGNVTLPRLPDLRGMSLSYETWRAEHQDETVLTLKVRSGAQNDLFASLASDLGDYVARAQTRNEVVARLLARLNAWGRFLQERGEGGLLAEARRGLFGELWVLKRLIGDCSVTDIDSLVRGWVGPTGAPQDFVFDHCRIEVKATTMKQEQRLHINSERQLDWTAGPRLFLVHVSLAEGPSEGTSIPGLVFLVREALVGRAGADSFENALLQVGYVDGDQHLYSQLLYSVREDNAFEVQDGFPCIVERSVPKGVGELSYSVGVGSCAPFGVAWTEVVARVEGA